MSGAGTEPMDKLRERITMYLANNDSLTPEQLSDLLRGCRRVLCQQTPETCECAALKGQGICNACADVLRKQVQRLRQMNAEKVEQPAVGEAQPECIGKDRRSHFRVTGGNCACGWTIINDFEWEQHLKHEGANADAF